MRVGRIGKRASSGKPRYWKRRRSRKSKSGGK